MFENIREKLTPRNIALGGIALAATAIFACGGASLVHHINPDAVIHFGNVYLNPTGVLLDGCNSGFVQSTFGAQMTSFDWSEMLKGVQTFSTGCV